MNLIYSLNIRTIITALIYALLITVTSTSMVQAQNEIRLIVRGDDLGMTQGSIAAFQRAFTEGVITCAGIQVPAPWFEAAAKLSRNNPDWCMGVHLTIIGEWRGYRWRPVLPWGEVSSIVDQDGYLYRYPEELLANKPKIEEIEAEFKAQIKLAIKKGINLSYIDKHYLGYNSYPGLKNVFLKLGREFNLPVSGLVGETIIKGMYHAPEDEKLDVALKNLKKLKPGLWLWIVHLGIDSPEQNALIHTNPDDVFPGGGVGKHRAAELEVINSKEVKSVISKKGIKLINYKEIWEEEKGLHK